MLCESGGVPTQAGILIFHVKVLCAYIKCEVKHNGIWGWDPHGLNGWGIHDLTGWGIYDLNGCRIYYLRWRGK